MIKVVAPRGDRDSEQFAQVRAQSFAMPLTQSAERTTKQRPHALATFAFEGERVIGGSRLTDGSVFRRPSRLRRRCMRL